MNAKTKRWVILLIITMVSFLMTSQIQSNKKLVTQSYYSPISEIIFQENKNEG